ncbi:MAG: hypothetical protein DRP87_07955 [Spirochaetes bacterium]|nr:MAG: hypothetical protein DRP87_07955 [Spirochaetota bacterium]
MKKIILLLAFFTLAVSGFSQECGTLIRQPLINYFVMVIDRSGSMQGSPLDYAKAAVVEFLLRMRPDDRIAAIDFGSSIRVASNFTHDKRELADRVYRLRAGGGTRLYDAIVKAAHLLSEVEGFKVIVYLTDGMDNESTHSLKDIRSMNVGEGIFVYGVGLGELDHSSLRDLSDATNGLYRDIAYSKALPDIYSEVAGYHYNAFNSIYSEKGSYVISSLPPGRAVRIDGRSYGRSPVKIDGFDAGTHTVEVDFEKGTWTCRAESRAGYKTVIRARESDIPADLWIETEPHRSSVYIDGEFVGFSAMVPSIKGRRGSVDYSNQLRIPSLPAGRHTVKVIASPDFELGQSLEFDFNMPAEHSYLNVNILFKKATLNGVELSISGGFPGIRIPDN